MHSIKIHYLYVLWSDHHNKSINICLPCIRAQLLLWYPTLCNTMDCSPPGSSVHEDSPGKLTGVGSHALLKGGLPNPEMELVSPASPALQANSFNCRAIGEVAQHLHSVFSMMRTFKIYSFGNLQTCNTILLTIVTLLFITSPWLNL